LSVRLDARAVARALGGEAYGNRISAPASGHTPNDRSSSVVGDPVTATTFADDCDKVMGVAALAAKPAAKADPLEVFIVRSEVRAYLEREGDLALHEAVDVLQAAAVQTGLVGTLGQDTVQAIMARAFALEASCASDPNIPDEITEKAEPGIRAAASTAEALMFSLCKRGAAALSEKSSQRRLAELSTAQIFIVLERLIAARPRFPVIDDELLFLLGEQLR